MPVELSVSQVLHTIPAVVGNGNRSRIFEAAADRSILQENPNGPMLPPAGASRAEAIFTAVGIVLLLILAFSFLWILLRQRRR